MHHQSWCQYVLDSYVWHHSSKHLLHNLSRILLCHWRTFTNFTFLILSMPEALQIFSSLSESKNLTFDLLSFLSSFIDSSLFSFMFNLLYHMFEITTCEVCHLSDCRIFDVKRLYFLWVCCFMIFVFCFKISWECSCDHLPWLFCDTLVRSELSALRT